MAAIVVAGAAVPTLASFALAPAFAEDSTGCPVDSPSNDSCPEEPTTGAYHGDSSSEQGRASGGVPSNGTGGSINGLERAVNSSDGKAFTGYVNGGYNGEVPGRGGHNR